MTTAPIDFNFNRRPCPKCGEGSSVSTVQNDWNRGIPLRYRMKRWIRRKISCSHCSHSYWTIELPEIEFDEIATTPQGRASDCLLDDGNPEEGKE